MADPLPKASSSPKPPSRSTSLAGGFSGAFEDVVDVFDKVDLPFC